MRRIVSVWLPTWPTDRRARIEGASSPFAAPDRPAALTVPDAGALRLAALNAAAEREGLYRGQPLAAARAILPGLAIAPADSEGDINAVHALARAAACWSPLVAPRCEGEADFGLALDIAGAAHLFGGEAVLLRLILTRLAERGVAARAACARTHALAWGLARFDPRAGDGLVVSSDRGQERSVRESLPVEALRLAGETTQALRALGLKTVGGVLAQPRGGLARRFGVGLILRLDQMLGEQVEAIEPVFATAPCMARARFSEPLQLREGLIETARRLAEDVAKELEVRAEGARTLRMLMFRVDGHTFEITVGAARPTRDPAHIARLLGERLERLEFDVGFGVDVVELAATETERLDGDQPDLGEADAAAARDVAALVDRLAAHLGADAVKRAGARESRLPERAAGWRARVTEAACPAPARPAALLRLPRPEPVEAVAEVPDGPPRLFRWRKVLHRVARAEGPERVSSEWWRAGMDAQTRDYFRVETAEGRRFELYREGLFGRETEAPVWFVHGAGG